MKLLKHGLKFIAMAAILFSPGCGGGGGGGGGGGTPSDIGDNNPNVIVALGDSITEGRSVPAGAPYPSRLASMIGKTVLNSGVSGELSAGGSSRVESVLTRNPAFLLILYGANDIIRGRDDASIIANLNAIIQAAKANKTVPVLANLLPMYDDHGQFNARVQLLNPQIASLARSTGARFVNLSKEFGNNRDLLQADGLHPSDRGNAVIAAAFADRL